MDSDSKKVADNANAVDDKKRIIEKKKRVYLFFLSCFVLAFMTSSYLLISHELEKERAREKLEKIREERHALLMEKREEVRENAVDEQKRLHRKSAQIQKEKDREKKKNAHALHKRTETKSFDTFFDNNSDFVAWISQKDARIDHPLMYHESDPTYYLRRDFNGNYSLSGTPFLDIRTVLDEGSNQKEVQHPTVHIIYGHNMEDGTMFSNLHIFENVDMIKKSEPIILETKNYEYKYKIFASLRIEEYTKKADYVYNKTSFHGEEDYNDYIDFIKEHAFSISDDIPDYGDDVLLLFTCSSHKKRGRQVLLASRIVD